MGQFNRLKTWFLKLSLFAKLFLLLIVVGLIWFTYSKVKANQAVKPQYQTAQVEKGTLVSFLSTSGQVAATNSRTVTTTASGVVKTIFVKEGQKVSVGSSILSIDLDLNGRQQFQSASSSYQSAQNSLKSAQDKIYSLQSTLVNAQNIFNNQWANQSPDDPTYIQKHNDLLSAQSAYDSQQNVIKQVRTSLESSRLSYQMASNIVYAPISGTVSAISLTSGMILNPTSNSSNSSNIENKIAIVKTGATPAITVDLTEIDVPKIKPGDKATITLSALPNKTFTGKIIAIDTTGIISSGVVNYPTTIQLDSDAPELLPNMSATADIITGIKDNVLLVPLAAVQSSNGQLTVRIMKNGQVTSVPVEVGSSNDTQTEIISGLNEGDTVVTAITNSGSQTNTQTTSPFSSLGGGNRGGAIRLRNP
jgi:macrolide-specific efflux system membrane fusion protein